MVPEDQEPFFTSNPLGLPYIGLPKVDPNFKKPEKIWLEYVVEGSDDAISEKIEEMRKSAESLNFDEMMDAFEEIERDRRLQIGEITRELADLKRKISPETKPEQPAPEARKTITINPDLRPRLDLNTKPEKSNRQGVLMMGLLVLLTLFFIVFMMKIAADNTPPPKIPRERYLEQKMERDKSPGVRQMELEDQLQEARDQRPISGPQDNRGYSDE